METLSPEEQRGITRERLVEAALGLIDEEGLEGLSMRALADRLQVKAASLYWHVRDRRELLDLLAEAILDGTTRTRTRATWRETVSAISRALRRQVLAHKDANRILLEVPGALSRSDVFSDLASALRSAGLQDGEAAEVARMVATQVIADPAVSADERGLTSLREPASIWIDTGSRGVVLRAGSSDMQGLIRVPPDQSGAAPAVVRGEHVVVRRLRGVGRGEIELNPQRPWKFKVQGPTLNTALDLAGIDVREIWIDSGAANIECYLPAPTGVVPIHVSSGVVNVTVRRARGAAVVATVHTGVLNLKLDDYSARVTVLDVNWQSNDALGAPDRYELDVSSGVVDFRLDEYEPKVLRSQARDEDTTRPASGAQPASALDILLDGVEARVAALDQHR